MTHSQNELITRIEETLSGDPDPDVLFDLSEDIIGESLLLDDPQVTQIMTLRTEKRLDLLQALGDALGDKAAQEPNEDFQEIYIDQARRIDRILQYLEEIENTPVRTPLTALGNNTFNAEADQYRKGAA